MAFVETNRPELPNGWQFRRLLEIADVVDSLHQTPKYVETGVPMVRVTDIKPGFLRLENTLRVPEEVFADFTRNARPQRGDIVFSRVGSYGISSFVNANDLFCLGQNTALIRPKINPRYIYSALQSSLLRQQIESAVVGSTQKTISLKSIRELEIPVCEDGELNAIASVLGALDDKIELNRRMNETLEALARSLFKSWFVETTQSALPKGWRYATIAELCEINSWTLGKGDELDRIEYVEISEVMRGNIANIQSYARGEEPSRARRRLRHGDTVLSTVRPDRGAYFLCLNPSPNLIGSTGFAVLTPKKAPWSFIHAAMTQTDVFEYLGQQADGGAYPAVRSEIIGALEVPWPSKPELVEVFHRACAPLYERAELNRQESRTLAALRDALLPKLLSGELRVPAAAGKLAEATA